MGNAEAIAAAFAGGLPPGISGTNDRCTILVSNLNSDVSFCSLSEHEYHKIVLFIILLLLKVILES